jgi:hypothetical protein
MANFYKRLATFIMVVIVAALVINSFIQSLDNIEAGKKCTADLVSQGIKPEQIYTNRGTCYLRTN